MPFMTGEKLAEAYKRAKKEKWAFVASNVAEPNILMGLINGAVETNSDLLLQVSMGAAKFAGNNNPKTGLRILSNLVKSLAADAPIGVAINIDHGQDKDMDIIKMAVEEELVSSVMIDASKFPFEENLEITKKVVQFAHQKGIMVEAELGKILGTEDEVTSNEEVYTDPEEAEKFIKDSGCDLLAIAIGTNHGVSKGKKMKLRIDVAKAVNERLINAGIETPLVLHGASGLLEDQVKAAIAEGVCKVNKDTRYQFEFGATAAKFYIDNKDAIIMPAGANDDDWSPDKKIFDPRNVSKKVSARIAEVYKELAIQTGMAGKSIFK